MLTARLSNYVQSLICGDDEFEHDFQKLVVMEFNTNSSEKKDFRLEF